MTTPLLNYENVKDELHVLKEQKLSGALIRSRAQLVKEEEKPTNF